MNTHTHTHAQAREHIPVHGTLDLHFFKMGIATVAWGSYDVLPHSSRRLVFPSDKREEACIFSLLRRVWITSVAEQQNSSTHTHPYPHTHTQRLARAAPFVAL